MHDAADEPAGLGPRAHRRVRGPVAVPARRRPRAAASPSWRSSTTPSETPRADRGEIPYLRRDEALAYMEAVRERALGVLDARRAADAGSLGHARPARAPAQRDDAADAAARRAGHLLAGADRRPARRRPRRRAWSRSSAGPFEMGIPGDGFAYDNERPRHEVDLPAFEIDRAPVTNGAYAEFVEDGGYARRALWSEAGWEWRSARARPAALLDRRRRGAALRPDRAARARPAGDARLLVRGRRLRALARRAAADRGRVGEGGRDRTARAAATSTSSTSARAPPGRSWATAGSGRRARSAATPASRRSPTASTPRSSSAELPGAARRVVGHAAERGARHASATGTSPSGARSSPASGARDERSTVGTHDGRSEVRDGPHARAEGAPAQVLLRRARLGAVRPDHHAARVLPDPLRARDPQPARAGDRGRDAPSWSSSGRARRRRRARCCTRWRAPGRCRATCRSTWTRSVGRAVRRRAGRALPGPDRARRGGRLRARPRARSPTASTGCSRSSAGRSATSTRPSASASSPPCAS